MVMVILTTTMAIQRSFGWRNRGHLECTSAYLFIFSTKIVGTSDQQNRLCTTISITTTLLYTSFCPDFESNLSLLFSNRCINFDFSFFLPRGMMDKVGDQWTSAAPTCFYAFAISVLSSLSLVPALCSIFLLLDSSLQFLFLCSLFRLPVFLWWDQLAPQMHQDWGLHRSPSFCG